MMNRRGMTVPWFEKMLYEAECTYDTFMRPMVEFTEQQKERLNKLCDDVKFNAAKPVDAHRIDSGEYCKYMTRPQLTGPDHGTTDRPQKE